jgi:rhomboid family GlyGly-CTERM serine protease
VTSRQQKAAGCKSAPPRFLTQGVGRAVVVALLLVLPALVVALNPALGEALQFQREAVADGEWWRIITCHWTHWSMDHLIWDAFPFALLVLLAWRISPRRMLWTLGLSAVLIPVGAWIFYPQVLTYRGLSGLDSALFLLVALDLCRSATRDRQWVTVVLVAALLAGFMAKVLFEVITGTTLFADSAFFVPLPLAHLIGAQCGALAAARDLRPEWRLI